jgi:hypothetical protein
VLPGVPPRVVSVDGEKRCPWTLIDVSEPGVAGALAVAAPEPIIRRFSFSTLAAENCW